MAGAFLSGSAAAWDDGRPLDLDTDGNVKRLAPGQIARTVVFAGADPGLSKKKFLLRWQGTGKLEFGNVQVLRRTAHSALLQLQPVTGPDTNLIVNINIVQTLPTDPVRALRLLPPSGGICTNNPLRTVASAAACPAGTYRSFDAHHASIVFNPEFLEDVKRYSVLRFMDWASTNNSPLRSWSQRALRSHQFWSTDRGVPIEAMLSLANLLGADPWLCIPHLADDAFVTALSKLLKAQLGVGRKVHLEYSNEVWNGQFQQTQWALAQADALKLHPTDRYTGLMRFYSRRSQQIFRLVAAAMGGHTRLRRVMATQAVVPYFTESILAWEAARNLTDLFAIAPYFGNTWTEPAQAAALKRLGVDGVFAWLDGKASAADQKVLEYGSLPSIDAVVAAQASVLRPLGIPLTAYEGGQHLLAAGTLHSDSQLNALLDAVNRDPRMKGTYLRYLASWRSRTAQPMVHFVHCDGWSAWGRWGAEEYPSQPRSKAPKLDALLTYIATRPLPV